MTGSPATNAPAAAPAVSLKKSLRLDMADSGPATPDTTNVESL
jgi:hypothetical protein